MVRKNDDDPMFLTDAINAQTKDDENKKAGEETPSPSQTKDDENKKAGEETPSEEPKKSDVDLQKS